MHGAHTLFGNGVFFAQDATNIINTGINSFCIYYPHCFYCVVNLACMDVGGFCLALVRACVYAGQIRGINRQYGSNKKI